MHGSIDAGGRLRCLFDKREKVLQTEPLLSDARSGAQGHVEWGAPTLLPTMLRVSWTRRFRRSETVPQSDWLSY